MALENKVRAILNKPKQKEADLSRFPLRVAIICPYSMSIPGGVQNQVILQMNYLRKSGVDARIIAPCDGVPPNQYIIPVGTTRAIKGNGSLAPIADDIDVTSMTLGAISNFTPDVLHLHEPIIPGPTIAAMVGADVAMVATFHAAGEGTQAIKYFRHPARGAISRVQKKVCVSSEAKALANKFLPGEYSVIPNAIDLSLYKNVEPWPHTKPVAMFVGRHEDRKGLRYLIEAWLNSDLAQDKMELWVAGTGEETNELIAKTQHCKSIHFLGRISDLELRRRLASSEIFVAPSTGGESFGIILLEAMASNCAIVASDIPGYAGVVRNETEALMVKPKNSEFIRIAIEELIKDSAKTQTLKINSAKRVKEFSIEKIVDKYRKTYEDAIEQHRVML